MGKLLSYSVRIMGTFMCLAFVFSCQNRINDVRQMRVDEFTPQTIETGVHVVYTDSGVMTAKLKSPKLMDYSNLEFPYREFPKGVFVEFYGDQNKKNTVTADYAIVYNATNLVDLRGHVKVITGDSTIITAQQLYWDRERNWVFTDQNYTIKMNNGTVNSGAGFDSNQKFNNFISRSNTGIHYIEDKKK